MNEQRFVVSEVLLLRLGSHLSGKLSDAGATAKDNRLFLQAVLWQGIRERIRDRRAAVIRRCLIHGFLAMTALQRLNSPPFEAHTPP